MKIRKALKDDLFSIVQMLADDELGSQRENFQSPLPSSYLQAFEHIDSDSNQELMVVENDQGAIVGTFQLTFIQYITYQGGLRAQIEAVRIRKDQRGEGLGSRMFEWAINRAKARGAHVFQLTTDKKRPQALKFYESLGFTATHEGMKMHFSNPSPKS